MAESLYICQVNAVTLADVVSNLAPACDDCGQKMTYICVEKCCAKKSVYCRQCCMENHIAHRTNQIRMLFLNKTHLQDINTQQEEVLKKLINFIKEQQKASELIVEHQLNLIRFYKQNIIEIEGVIKMLNSNAWYHELYQCVEGYLTNTVPLAQSREIFSKKVIQINLESLMQEIDLKTVAITIEHLTQKVSFPEPNLSKEQIQNLKKTLTSIVPNNHLKKIMLNTALEVHVKDLPLKDLDIINGFNRSRIMNWAELKEKQFSGSRLILNSGAKPSDWKKQLRTLRELSINAALQTFPKGLLKLNLSIGQLTQQILAGLPRALRHLHLNVQSLTAPLTEDIFVDALLSFNSLSKLTISLQINSRGNKIKLMRMGNSLKEMCYGGIGTTIENCIKARKRRLLQITLIQRTIFIREMHGACVEELMDAIISPLQVPKA